MKEICVVFFLFRAMTAINAKQILRFKHNLTIINSVKEIAELKTRK